VVREVIPPSLGSLGYVDGEGRLWYQTLVTQPAAKLLLCAVPFPGDDLQRYPGLEEGRYYPRWFLNRQGVETQAEAGDFRKARRAEPGR